MQGAAQVGATGAQHVGATGAQQVGAGAQQLGLQHLVLQHLVLQHLVLQQCILGILQQRCLWQLLQPLLQQEAAGAAHVGAQTAAGAQHVGAGAQQLGAGAQQLLLPQLLPQRPKPPKQPAFASVALAQQNSMAAINVVHFIIVISWNGYLTSGTEANPRTNPRHPASGRLDALRRVNV